MKTIFWLIGLFLFINSNNIVGQSAIIYTYDNAHRLVKVEYGNGTTILYTYNKVGSRLSKITLVPCTSSDLIVSDIQITKYTPEKIYYTLQIKNIGTQTANLSSFALGAYNSNSNIKDANSEFKSALYTGGSLAPNATMNINYSSGFNFTNDKYYLLLTADNYNSVVECVETNNTMAKLVNPCTENTNLTITGNHSNELLSTNGGITISNAFIDNVLIVGKSVSELPNTEFKNSSIVIGGCLNGGPVDAPPTNAVSNLKDETSGLLNSDSPISNLQFSQFGELTFEISQSTFLSIAIYGDTEKSLINEVNPSTKFESKNQKINIDTSKWIKGQKYSIHIKSEFFDDVLVVDW